MDNLKITPWDENLFTVKERPDAFRRWVRNETQIRHRKINAPLERRVEEMVKSSYSREAKAQTKMEPIRPHM